MTIFPLLRRGTPDNKAREATRIQIRREPYRQIRAGLPLERTPERSMIARRRCVSELGPQIPSGIMSAPGAPRFINNQNKRRSPVRWGGKSFGISSWTANEPISRNPSGVPILDSCAAQTRANVAASLLLTQPGSRRSADFQNWPGCAGGLCQSDRRLFGLFRSNKSCLKIKPLVGALIDGGIFRTSWVGATTTPGRTTQPAGYSMYWQ